MDYKTYSSAVVSLTLKLRELYSCLWGQCDPALQNKIKFDMQFETADDKQDVLILLLDIIDTICSSSNTVYYYPLECMTENAKLHKFCQGKGVSTAEYYQEFVMLLKSAENAGVNYSTSGMCQYAAQKFQKKDYSTVYYLLMKRQKPEKLDGNHSSLQCCT